MSIFVVLMFTKMMVTKSTQANVSLVLLIKEPFGNTEVRLGLPVEELDAFLDNLFPF
jgi:hypothetical protein